jgi:hypothetical protein
LRGKPHTIIFDLVWDESRAKPKPLLTEAESKGRGELRDCHSIFAANQKYSPTTIYVLD